MDTDEIAPPPKKTSQPLNLDGMSIAELEAHILDLEGEIQRTQDVIAAKRKARGSAEDIFRR